MSATYFNSLTQQQRDNIAYITKRMGEKGITNPLTQSAILAVVSKESGFIPKSETSYSTTSNARIRQIFGSRVASYSDEQLTNLKKNDEAFFNAIYGLPQYGQTTNEGYKYRGRGLNQITFKGNYQKIGNQIGVDLVNNPDKLNTLPVATDALLQYFLNAFKAAPADKLALYGGAKHINDFKTIADSSGAVYHANAGWGKSLDAIIKDQTGGKAKTDARAPGFFAMVQSVGSGAVEAVKKNPLTTALMTAGLLVSAYFLYKLLKTK